jgi:hypothetical protein
VAELEQRLRNLHPAVIAVFVKPQTAIGYAEAVDRWRGKTRQIVFHAPPQGPA